MVKQKTQSNKEVHLLIFVFVFTAMVSIGAKYFEYFVMQEMSRTTADIFEHTLKVSDAVIDIKVHVYKMDRDMQDIVLSATKEHITELQKELDEDEKHVYENLGLIEENILDEAGLTLAKDTRELFNDWKPIREEVNTLIETHQTDKAIDIAKGEGDKHVEKLEDSASKLNDYAHNKAIGFKNKSESSLEKLKIISISMSILFLLIFASIGLYVITRISKFIYKNEYSKNVLSVIRDVNQLIVREKDKRKLLEESCKILISKHVYGNAWIIILDSQKKPEYLINTDRSEKATLFKEKIESGWIPHCIEKISQTDETYSVIEKVKGSCQTCPLIGLYNREGACTVELKYNEKSYGYLTLAVNNKYITDSDELALRWEVAGDIAHALYNIDLENDLKKIQKCYEAAEEIGKVGAWEYDVTTQDFWASAEAKRIYGFSADLDKFSTDTVENCIPERERIHQAMEDLLEKGTEYNLEFEVHPFDGTPLKIISSIAKVEYDENKKPKKVLGLIQDITQRKEAERLLQEKKKELETILQEAPNPIMLHNEDGSVIFVNNIWLKITRYSYDEINTIEKWITKAYGKAMPIIKKKIDNLYGLTDFVIDEAIYDIHTKSGDIVTWRFNSTPLGIIDGKRTIISSAMDITELKKKDELIMVQSRHAAMGEMIGMIAHQWRQPLSVIALDANNMLVDIQLQDFSTTKAENYAKGILHQTQHLSQTIDDFRNFFKSDKAIAKVNMQDVLEESYLILKDSLSNNGIELKRSYASVSEVDAYPRELMQVFVNILNNSKDSLLATHRDDLFIKVQVYQDEHYVITEICDNGTGIDENILEKIFDPYFTTKDEMTGTGLGLYMSKVIIENHLHGKLEAFNTDNGACFRVMLLKNNTIV